MRDAIFAIPLSAGTVQALHTVSRTWLRGGSPHLILNKINKWYGMPRFCRRFGSLSRTSTVPLYKRKRFISRSRLILVLTTVLGRPRRADVKKVLKTIMGKLLHEKIRF